GGGQFKQAVQAIIEAESQPIKQLQARKGREEAKMKTFQEFKGKFANFDKTLADMTDFHKFGELKVDLGDGANLVGVTLDKEKAQPGTYTIQIDQLAGRSSVMSNGFKDPNENVLGDGFINFTTASGEKTSVYIENKDSSINGVASVINRQNGLPVRASVVKDASSEDSPWRLILTAKKEGVPNGGEFPEFYFNDAPEDFYINDSHEARNAIVNVDGFPVELDSNDVPDFFPGINLKLKEARPDNPFTITVSQDNQKVGGKVKTMVEQLNGILQFIVKQNSVDEKTDTQTMFTGDTSLQSIEYRVRNLLHEGFPYTDPKDPDKYKMMFLNDLGIEFDKTGSLNFKEEKFNKILDDKFDTVAEAITGEFGLATQLKSVMAMYTRAGDGMLASKEKGMRARIKDIDNQIENKTRALERKQQSVVEQFSRLEASLSNMQKQQQYLSASMPTGGGGNMVAQLLGG
ncbi:MAG: flagellar filament capping protein FliD, partial [Bdellovibrionota bacterium]